MVSYVAACLKVSLDLYFKGRMDKMNIWSLHLIVLSHGAISVFSI